MITNKIIYFSGVDDLTDAFQPFLREISMHPVNQDGLFIPQEIGIIGSSGAGGIGVAVKKRISQSMAPTQYRLSCILEGLNIADVLLKSISNWHPAVFTEGPGVIFTPGGDCRRLYSLVSTIRTVLKTSF